MKNRDSVDCGDYIVWASKGLTAWDKRKQTQAILVQIVEKETNWLVTELKIPMPPLSATAKKIKGTKK